MDSSEKARLFHALVKAGWKWREGSLYAPNGTMWLDEANPWQSSLREFRERMIGRADRLRKNVVGATDEQKLDFEHAMADLASRSH